MYCKIVWRDLGGGYAGYRVWGVVMIQVLIRDAAPVLSGRDAYVIHSPNGLILGVEGTRWRVQVQWRYSTVYFIIILIILFEGG